ncbi:MAG: SDR family NAD(P)-dependent oxidoreductase [Woeseiaceae bacterium]
MSEALRLFGLKAVVTDASSGIGEAIVRTFVKHGASVLAVDRPGSAIETHFRRVEGVTGMTFDFSESAAAPFVAQVKSTLGGLDIFVINFDWHRDAPIGDGDREAIEEVQRRMTDRVTEICNASLSAMEKSPAGRIIAVGCLRSVFGIDGAAAYRDTAAALERLMARIAAQSAEMGITANAVQPGAVMTPVSRKVYAAHRDLRDHCIARSAAKRLGEPVDIAKVALFLATDDSVFVSGTAIVADGGASSS